MKKTIAIVHYNTPEVTRALVLSIRKHGGEDHRIVIFENSDVEPFAQMARIGADGADGLATEVASTGLRGVEIIDNTRGQVVDFGAELKKYPRKNHEKSCYGRSVFGSVKHSMSVEWLVQNMDGPFVLADSDILLKGPIDELWDEKVTAAGTIEREWAHGVERLQPYLCFINAPECRRRGIHYFDPMRTWGLGTGKTEKENWYDTGASFLEDILQCDGASLKKINTLPMMVHLGGASYVRTRQIPEWLWAHKDLWNPDYQYDGQRTIISRINMDNVRVMTQDGKQYRLTADDGYLLKAKDTGDVRKSVNTMKLERWEVIVDPDAKATGTVTKAESKKKAQRVRKA